MDKLDRRLHESKQELQVSSELVDKVMSSVKALPQPKKRQTSWFRHKSIWIGLPALIVVLMMFFIFSTGGSTKTFFFHTKGSTSSQSGGSVATKNQVQQAAEGSSSNGTDNASLASELNGISNGLNENQQSFNAANDAMNNQQLDTPPSD